MVKTVAALLALLLAASPARAEWVDLALPTGGTLKADLELPAGAGSGKWPAVIYMHGRLVREIGHDDAAGRGYDVADFARAFADAGFVAVAPVRKTPAAGGNGDEAVTEGLSAILAAMDRLRTEPHVDAKRIAVAGFGEGATIALWALARMPDLAAGVVMSPAALDGGRADAKTLSFARFAAGDAIRAIRAPVLITVGEDEAHGARRRAETLARKLIGAYKRFRFIHTYRGDTRWFWQPRDAVMTDVTRFLDERMR